MKVQIDIVFNPNWTAVLLLLRSRDLEKSADRAFLASACKMFGTLDLQAAGQALNHYSSTGYFACTAVLN